MDHELSRLRSEGELGEPGRFTVDPARARQILASHTLEVPETYVLKLVQWAVRSRAQQVRVELSHRRVTVEHDGETTTAGTLESLLVSENPAAFHLAVGLHGSLKLEPSSVVLQSAGSRRVLLGSDATIATKLPQSVSILGLRSGLAFPSMGTGFLQDLLWMRRPEYALTRCRCVFAPVPVFLNGRPVNQPWFGFPSHVEAYERGIRISATPSLPERRRLYLKTEGEDCIAAPAEDYRGNYFGDTTRHLKAIGWTHEPAIACRAALLTEGAFPGKYPSPSDLFWVHDGVTVERERDCPLLPRGTCAVVALEDVRTDISQFRVIRDEKYEAILRRLSNPWEQGPNPVRP